MNDLLVSLTGLSGFEFARNVVSDFAAAIGGVLLGACISH